MTGNTIGNVLAAVLLIALVTTIVAHKGSAGVITAGGRSFAGVINAAEGSGLRPGV